MNNEYIEGYDRLTSEGKVFFDHYMSRNPGKDPSNTLQLIEEKAPHYISNFDPYAMDFDTDVDWDPYVKDWEQEYLRKYSLGQGNLPINEMGMINTQKIAERYGMPGQREDIELSLLGQPEGILRQFYKSTRTPKGDISYEQQYDPKYNQFSETYWSPNEAAKTSTRRPHHAADPQWLKPSIPAADYPEPVAYNYGPEGREGYSYGLRRGGIMGLRR